MSSSIRAGLRRLPAVFDAATRAQVCRMTHGSMASLNICRSFSNSSTNFSKENSYNFNVQDEEDFQKRVIEAKTPMVVDFHAEWCGPCKVLGPRLEKAVDEHEGKILLAKVDVDDLSDIAMKYKVRAVPTVVGVNKGETVWRFEGSLQDADLKAYLNKLSS